MTWTVACFCGHTYQSPPDHCQVCGRPLDHEATGRQPDRTLEPHPQTNSIRVIPPKADLDPRPA